MYILFGVYMYTMQTHIYTSDSWEIRSVYNANAMGYKMAESFGN